MNLFELRSKYELHEFLEVGDILEYNGGYFSDCSYFSKNKEYKITGISQYSIKVKSNMSFISINIFPNGLKAFILKDNK